MVGKIVKGIAGFYYVHVANEGIYECKARGVFRNKKIKPIVGDNVEIEINDKDNLKGNIINILPRKNELYRPLITNIDQIVITFAVAKPEPNFYLLDRFLVGLEKELIDIYICFNKIDLLEQNKITPIVNIYKKAGYNVLLTSVKQMAGIDWLKEILYNKTTVFSGPSGVGKSSLFNIIQSNVLMETGNISEKIDRGKHTTRHAELVAIDKNGYIIDTPGFSNFQFNDISENELSKYFIEFSQFESNCKFYGCAHINEPECAIKEALNNKLISNTRYESYKMMYEELKDKRRW